jgi:hypothetical protein
MNARQTKVPGLCHVSGRHLSLAPNASSFAAIHEECQAEARAELHGALTDRDRKLAAQFAGPLEGESTFSEADLISADRYLMETKVERGDARAMDAQLRQQSVVDAIGRH